MTSYKASQISEHCMFPLVYVWVMQQGAWKLHPYNSIAKMHNHMQIFPIQPKFETHCEIFVVMTFVLL